MNFELETDPLGMAINDYYSGRYKEELIVNNNYGQPEIYPVDYFFRRDNDFPEIELYAMNLCAGRILDIGAGVGPHSLYLQSFGKDVTAIDNSQAMVSALIKNGIKKVIYDDIFKIYCQGFKTALLMMNGIGIVGTIKRFKTFLNKMEGVLHPDGQILFDSTDISYVFDPKSDLRDSEIYFGEVKFQFEYKKKKGEWFNWLYLDSQALFEACNGTNWNVQIIFENEYQQYLARLVRKMDESI